MKLTILGGGGFRVPQVLQALAADAAKVVFDEVALYDIDSARLRAVGQVIKQLELPRVPRLTLTSNLDTAVSGADFVFCAIRVGGTEGRIIDEQVALSRDVLGQETTGPGGLAYVLRTVPVMTALAKRVKALAPQAWLINFTNPAGAVTEALRRVLGERVVGICDTPIGLLRRAARAVGSAQDPLATSFDYVGLNHLGWLRSFKVDGRDRLPDLLANPAALSTIEEVRLMGLEWVQSLGALPNEYLYYYYFNREAVTQIKAGRQTRGQFLDVQQAAFYKQALAQPDSAVQIWTATKNQRESTYMAESRPDGPQAGRDPEDLEDGGYQQVALNVMAALALDQPTQLILNVANAGLVPPLGDEAVIEVPCTVDANGFHPQPIAPVNGHMLALMQSVKAAEQLAIEAALTASAALAVKAMAVHPLVDSVNIGRELFNDYRSQHQSLARLFG